MNYNRYTYAMNNPLKYTDSTGYRYGSKLKPDGSLAYDENGRPVASDMPEYSSGGYSAQPGLGPIYDEQGYVTGFGKDPCHFQIHIHILKEIQIIKQLVLYGTK